MIKYWLFLLGISTCFAEVRTVQGGATHWVGDGFKVTSFLPGKTVSYDESSPFVLLDYMGKATFPPNQKKGVGAHPHRGFETVTILYEGEISHKDSVNGEGTIGPGDVQWMTAGSGVVHEEFHNGGTVHGVQLWVNLPKAKKWVQPRYQTLRDENMKRVALDYKGSYARVIAGNFHGLQGIAETHTPIDLIDFNLAKGTTYTLPLNPKYHTLVLYHGGSLLYITNEKEIAITGSALVMSGEPIDEPVAHFGPFVMNTQEEIEQARRDFRK